MTTIDRPKWKRMASTDGFLTYKFRMDDGLFVVAASKSGIYLSAGRGGEQLSFGTYPEARELASETAEIMRRLVAEYDYLRSQEENTDDPAN